MYEESGGGMMNGKCIRAIIAVIVSAVYVPSLHAAAAIEDIDSRPASRAGSPAVSSGGAAVSSAPNATDRSGASGQALLELMRRIEELQIEVQNLRGEVEGMNSGLDAVKTRQREMFLDLDRRMQDVEAAAQRSASAPSTDAAGGGTASGPGVAPASAPAVDPAAARSGYERAFGLLREQKYDAAIGEFERFMKDYGQSEYAANAQYWLGEANYAVRRYDQAATAFKAVINNYPASGKVADAYLKLGFTYYELSRWADARQALNSAKSQFPNSSAARLAQDRLNRMVQEGH